MGVPPNELQVTTGNMDTGIRGRQAPDRTKHDRRVSYALLLGIAAAISMVLLSVRIGQAVRDPARAASVAAAPAKPRKQDGWDKSYVAGLKATRTGLAWSGIIGAAVLTPLAIKREKIKRDFAKVQLRKAHLVPWNERGQIGTTIDYLEENPGASIVANDKHLLNCFEQSRRPITQTVGNYSPHYVNQGHVVDSMDPLEQDGREPVVANPFTVLDVMKADVPGVAAREEILLGMSEQGPEKVPLIHHGGCLIYGKSQYGKSTAAKNESGQFLWALGDVVAIDPDRENSLGFCKGLGYKMGAHKDVTQFFALPPARTVEEVGLVVEHVQARLDYADESGVKDHLLLVVDELVKVLRSDGRKEFLPKDLRDALTNLMGEIQMSGPKHGVYLAAILHLTAQKDTGGAKVRPVSKTFYLFNMEAGQARTVINNNDEAIPPTGNLRPGECWIRYEAGGETRFVLVRTPMCPEHELEEMVKLLSERREGRTETGLIVPTREIWTPATESLPSGTGAPARDSFGSQIAIEPTEPPVDPDFPEITVDNVMEAKFRLLWTDGQIVDGFWPEKYHGNRGGHGRQQKIKLVSDTIAKYAGTWLARQAEAEAQAAAATAEQAAQEQA